VLQGGRPLLDIVDIVVFMDVRDIRVRREDARGQHPGCPHNDLGDRMLAGQIDEPAVVVCRLLHVDSGMSPGLLG
jgi:hypothetical protein